MKCFTLTFVFLFIINLNGFSQEAKVTIYQEPIIETLLTYKKEIGATRLYTIQIYQGTDPDKASAERNVFRNNFPVYPVYIKWLSPNYKVWVGNFSSRLEADRALAKIRGQYPYANILTPK